MVYITNQKKLAMAAGIGTIHLSKVKRGEIGVSEDVAGKLEKLTGIRAHMWLGAGTKKIKLDYAMKKFFVSQEEKETEELKSLAL